MEDLDQKNPDLNLESEVNEKTGNRKRVVLLSIFTIFVIAILSFVLQFRIRYVAKTVQGWSMKPTLNEETETERTNGDLVYVNTYAEINPGDIVVISSSALKEDIIKRCIAVGGQTVNITGRGAVGYDYSTIDHWNRITLYEEYFVEVDGKKLTEDYILNYEDKKVMEYEYKQFCKWKYKNGYSTSCEGAIKLKENEIFALGDNRAGSTDSSAVGPFTKSEIIGRVDFVVKYKTSFIQECLQKLSFIFIIKK